MKYEYPKTKEEYWNTVDLYQKHLLDILEMFLPKDESSKFDAYRTNKDPKIVLLFDNAWSAAPDHIGIHDIPSWKVLCDLCSEAFLLEKPEDELK